MDTQRPKEPLVAVMLTLLLPGLGQMYAGKVTRGIIFLLINVLLVIGMILYFMNPVTPVYGFMLALIPAAIAFGLFMMIDAYLCARQYNHANNLIRKISTGNRIFLIIGLVFFSMFNSASLLEKYIRSNVFQSFRIANDSMNPVLVQNDRILVNMVIYKHSMPQRGDIVVFQYPGPDKKASIKRLIALPGEKIVTKKDGVYVNGDRIDYPELRGVDFFNRKTYDGGEPVREFDVPSGFYFLIDKKMGAVMPLGNLLGKAFKIYYPFATSGPIP